MGIITVRLPNGKLQEMRHPDDWSRSQIEDSIKKHFPSEPGNKQEEKGFSGIASDILGSIKNAPSAITESLLSLPEQAYESGKQVLSHPIRAAENVAAGALEGIKGAYNIPLNLGEYLGKKEIGIGPANFKNLLPIINALKIEDTGLQKAVLGESQEGDALLQSIGMLSPYTKLASSIKASGIAKSSLAPALAASSENENPIIAALMGVTGEGVSRGIDLSRRKLNPLNQSSPLSNNELRESRDITEGTETNLGDVIKNPRLKEIYENVIAKIPFSGATQAMQRTAEGITSKGKGVLNELVNGEPPKDLGRKLVSALKNSEKETRQIKNEKFGAVNDEADKSKVVTTRENMRNEAGSALKRIESDKDLAKFADKKVISLLKSLSSHEISPSGSGMVNSITGKKIDNPKIEHSLRNTDFLRGELGDMAHDAYQLGNTKLSKIFTKLKKATEKDINEAIDNSGNKELTSLRDEAMRHYKEEYAPFDEPEIRKFIKKGADSDTIVNAFLKTSRVSDRSNLLQKLSSKLSKDERDLLAYAYYSKALDEGNLNPSKLKTLHKNLGENQKNVLLQDKSFNKKMQDYVSLIEKNGTALNLMFNPKTGNTVSSQFPLGAILGSASAAFTGGFAPGLLASLLPSALARTGKKALTSEKIRERVIDSIIKNRENPNKKSKAGNLLKTMISSQSLEPTEIDFKDYR